MTRPATARAFSLACIVAAMCSLVLAPVTDAGGRTAAYVAIEPCRALDTRTARGRLGAKRQLTLRLSGTSCGVPDGAVAVAATITAVKPTGPGHLTIWPADSDRPRTSAVNYDPRISLATANTLPVRLSSDGRLNVYSHAAAHITLDVMGYWERSGPRGDGRAEALSPTRILDTRKTDGRIRGGRSTTVDATAAGVPPDAQAVLVNLTVTQTASSGHITAWSGRGPRPTASVLNYAPDDTRAGGTIVPLHAGAFAVYSHAATHLVVDVTGYITGPNSEATSDGLFVPTKPRRLTDTRGGNPVFPNGTIEVPYRDNAKLAVLNTTIIQAWDAGWISLYGAGNKPRKKTHFTSTLNAALPTQTVANFSATPVAKRGIGLTASSGAHVAVDEYGYFVGTPTKSPRGSPGNPSPVITNRRVVIISDSAMAGVRWNNATSGFQGFRAEHDLESCRRVFAPSCRGREGYAPPTAYQEVLIHGRAKPNDILVIAVGYNDWHANFKHDITQVLRAARSQGYRHIVWVSLRADNGYHLPRSGLKSNYRSMNNVVRDLVAGTAWPELSIWDLERYTSRVLPNTWFTSDGVHETRLGSFGVADWISRHVAHLDSRPCPRPYGPVLLAIPCPNPDGMPSRYNFYPAISALYGL